MATATVRNDVCWVSGPMADRRTMLASGRGQDRPIVRLIALLAAVALGLPLGLSEGVQAIERSLQSAAPAVHPIDVYGLYYDDTPVSVTTTALWQKIPVTVTRETVRSDVTLWRRMQLEDWDTVPIPLRHEGLDAMFRRYRDLLANPPAWDRMTTFDWDVVPHPVRVVAYRHMADFWTGYYRLGIDHGISRKTVADTLTTLLMSESWFEHRALNVNRSGNRDVGLAQASDCTRARMSVLYAQGVTDVRFEEADYSNPWKATRFAAIWLGLLLDEVGGDLDAAVRAYHVGSASALRGGGHDYLEAVTHRMHLYVSNQAGPDAWRYVWHLDRQSGRFPDPFNSAR